MSQRFSGYPQINTPRGNVTLPAGPGDYVAYLDRILRESLPPPKAKPNPKLRVLSRRCRFHARRPLGPPPPPPLNHHLWNNHGIWFVVYTTYPTPLTKERMRQSLQTRCEETARLRR